MPGISQHQRFGDHLPFNRKDLQVEEVVEADGHTRVCTSGDLANGQQHARHEGDAVEAVGANGQLLAVVTEQGFLMGIEACLLYTSSRVPVIIASCNCSTI